MKFALVLLFGETLCVFSTYVPGMYDVCVFKKQGKLLYHNNEQSFVSVGIPVLQDRLID